MNRSRREYPLSSHVQISERELQQGEDVEAPHLQKQQQIPFHPQQETIHPRRTITSQLQSSFSSSSPQLLGQETQHQSHVLSSDHSESSCSLSSVPSLSSSHSSPSVALSPSSPVQPTQKEEEELSIPKPDSQCPNSYMSCTHQAFPKTWKLLDEVGIPFACCVQPMKEISLPNYSPPKEIGQHSNIPIVNWKSTGMVRCYKCRAYLNPFAQCSAEQGTWICNFCNSHCKVPRKYLDKLEKEGKISKFDQLNERKYGVVDIIPTPEFSTQPQAPNFIFLVDISQEAFSLGLVSLVVDAIKDISALYPFSEPQTLVSLLCVSSSVGFWNLCGPKNHPELLVVSDLKDLEEGFFPLSSPKELSFNFQDHKENFLLALDLIKQLSPLPTISPSTTPPPSSPSLSASSMNAPTLICLGSALRVCARIASSIGGKVISFSTAKSGIGEGQLNQNRENEAIIHLKEKKRGIQAKFLQSGELNSSNAKQIVMETLAPSIDAELKILFKPTSAFYKNLALECVGRHITFSLFSFSPNYSDLATLGPLCQITGGEIYDYGIWLKQLGKEVASKMLLNDLKRELTREIGYQSSFRFRASDGLKVKKLYGNFFTKKTDLLTFPSIDEDKEVVAVFDVPSTIRTKHIYIQTALLYTSTDGIRKIRVATQCLPVVKSIKHILSNLNINSVFSFISKAALQMGLVKARDYICSKAFKMIQHQKFFEAKEKQPKILEQICYFAHSLRKSYGFCLNPILSVDQRFLFLSQLLHQSFAEIREQLEPKLFNLLNLPSPLNISFVPPLPLSLSSVNNLGVYLLVLKKCLIVLIGTNAPPLFLSQVLNIQSLESLDFSQIAFAHTTSSQKALDVKSFVQYFQREELPIFFTLENKKESKIFFENLVQDFHFERGESFSMFFQNLTLEKKKIWWK